MMGFGGIFGILLIGLIIWAVFQFANKNGSSNPIGSGYGRTSDGEGSALDILKKRYARGEISKDEYNRMKRDLS